MPMPVGGSRWMRCVSATTPPPAPPNDLCIIPAVDVANVTLCLLNVFFLVFVCFTYARDSKTTHFNYTILRVSWTFSCFLISMSTLLQSIYRLAVVYVTSSPSSSAFSHASSAVTASHQQQLYGNLVLGVNANCTAVSWADPSAAIVPRSKILSAVSFSASDQIRALIIAMSVERSLATIQSHDYETNPVYRVVGPLLLLMTWAVGLPIAYCGSYGLFGTWVIVSVLLGMDVAGFSMMYVIMRLNRRLKKAIGQRLTQRYQITENIRLLAQMRSMFICEVFFQSLSMVAAGGSRFFFTIPHSEGPFSAYVVITILNGYVTFSAVTLFYNHYRRYRSVRLVLALVCRCFSAASPNAVDDVEAAKRRVREERGDRAAAIVDEYHHHFAQLDQVWETSIALKRPTAASLYDNYRHRRRGGGSRRTSRGLLSALRWVFDC